MSLHGVGAVGQATAAACHSNKDLAAKGGTRLMPTLDAIALLLDAADTAAPSLHGVTALISGVRKSLFVVDFDNRLGGRYR